MKLTEEQKLANKQRGTFRRIANTDKVDVFEYVDGGYDENS